MKTEKPFRIKRGHHIVVLIFQEDIIIINVYASNNRVSNYGRQKLIELKGEMDKSTLVVRDFSTLLSVPDDSSRQKDQ